MNMDVHNDSAYKNEHHHIIFHCCHNEWPQASVQFSCSVVSDSLQPHESQHARPPCPSPTPGVHSDLCPSSRWCHLAISSSVIPFSSCPQSLPASESFLMSQLFAWGGQSTGVSASASFPPKKSQGWSPSEWTGWISLESKGLSGIFSNTTVQKHQFFHKLSGTKQHIFYLMVLQFRSSKWRAPRLKSRCWQGCVLPGDSREESFSLITSASGGYSQSLADGQRASKSGWLSQWITWSPFLPLPTSTF